MKRYIILLITLSLVASCSYKEGDAFEQKPANRTNNTLETYKNTLEGDTYWQLSYFPKVSRSFLKLPRMDHSIGGYNIFLKFKDGKVSASAEFMPNNDEYTTYFSYQNTEAITLSFDTYSDVLHHFRRTSGQFPNARGGDIELEILEPINNGYSILGRSSATKMTLTKFTGNREEYLNKVRANTETLKGKGLNTTQIGGKAVTMVLFPSYRQIVFSYDGQDVQQTFVVTDKGLKFYEPVTVNGVTLDELYINEAKTALTTPDNSVTITFQAAPIQITATPMKIWFDQGFVSDKFLTTYNTVDSWIKWSYAWYDLKRNGFTDLKISTIKGNDNESVTGFTKFISYVEGYDGGVQTYYEVDIVGVGDHPNQVRFILKDPSDHKTLRTGVDRNQIQFYSWIVTILYRTMANKGPYTVQDGGDYYKFTSTTDSNYWFYLYK
ncbi:DUF4302 domain-containing protein [Capnocytophaga gingivalis]|uniref:DUF4302 domain-containing protein n=1 Tax=Capnocytophaga gingivalis TaxID=1017 RepID=A0ABU5ZBK6_9FLAO|nr:DUF4302 domain-containing protein [Capnocytophaga gingivalis]MEB3075102.1 DUF4302 domain-containing protein [Capnocytophaga gingivalis]